MTAASFATTAGGLPPAFVGEPYEAAVGVVTNTTPVATAVAISSSGSTDTGLPAGLSVNADGNRITGTPTGAASSPGSGSGGAQSGAGAYTVTLIPNGTDTSVKRQFTVNLYASRNDWTYRSAESVAEQSTQRNLR